MSPPEFDLNVFRKKDFENLKAGFIYISEHRGWSLEKIHREMNKEKLQDLVNYRKADPQENSGQTLADDFRRAMDELGLKKEERKRVAEYFLEKRVGRIKARLQLKSKDGWEETVEFLEGILSN